MVTTIRIIKLIIKFLIFIVLLPFIILWVLIKSQLFKVSLIKNLISFGISQPDAKALAKDFSLSKIIKAN